MHAAVVNVLGQAPVYQEFAEPQAETGEILIPMRAAGLHPVVKARAAGQHYSVAGEVPAIPGIDGVGLLEGKLVYCYAARNHFGTMAEKTVVRPESCIPLPDGLDPMQAAAIANPGMSAWLSLKLRAGLQRGESVLVLGATGVAGHLAIQAARYLGAKRVVGVGRNVEALAGSGVDAVIGLTQPEEAIGEALSAELRDHGIDVIIDYLWGRPTELLLATLAADFDALATRRRRLVEVGESAGRTIALPGALLRKMDLSLMGSGFGSVPLDQIVAAIPELFSLAAAGHLRVHVEPAPLAEVTAAWNRVEKGKRIVFAI
jgi:NADPH:quinone reductase-like Zn-dependent oxidoreductase